METSILAAVQAGHKMNPVNSGSGHSLLSVIPERPESQDKYQPFQVATEHTGWQHAETLYCNGLD